MKTTLQVSDRMDLAPSPFWRVGPLSVLYCFMFCGKDEKTTLECWVWSGDRARREKSKGRPVCEYKESPIFKQRTGFDSPSQLNQVMASAKKALMILRGERKRLAEQRSAQLVEVSTEVPWRRPAEDTPGDGSPCERGQMPEGTPSLQRTAALVKRRLLRTRARLSPLHTPFSTEVASPTPDSSCCNKHRFEVSSP